MNLEQPLISIIIPNYNHEKYLTKRLESIYNQTFQDFEVILLDDASTDGSLEILNNYKSNPKSAHLIINKKNSGSTFKQWQKGISLAKGKYIWIAESDDYCELTFLEKMVGFANKKPSTGVLYCQTIDVDEKGNKIINRFDYTKEFEPNIWKSDFAIGGKEFVDNYLLIKNVIPNASAVLVKKEFVEKAFFSESLVSMKMCGDWFFWIQITLQTNVLFLAEDLNYFRNHSEVSRNHPTLKIKRQRLIEEGVIRTFLLNNKLSTSVTENNYYNKWFKLHRKLAILNTKFYKGKLEKTSVFTFLKQFLKFKLTKKWL